MPMIDTLEELFTLGGECKCEAKHDVSTCSYEVTHVYRTCLWEVMICENAARNLKDPARGKNYARRFLLFCSGCKRPADLCWTLIPI